MPTNVRPIEHVAASIHDHGIVLLHTIDGRLFASNQTGARIWHGLQRHLPIDAITADLREHYRISHETALSDTARFLTQLERQRLVERSVGR
jgi:hypothetical protein